MVEKEYLANVAVNSLSENSIRELTEAARSGFGSAMTSEDVRNHILSGHVLHIFAPNENIVGFASYNLYRAIDHSLIDALSIFDKNQQAEEKKILFVNGMVVKAEYQGRGFLSRSLESMIKESQPAYIALRTQSMVPYHMLSKLGATYPSFENPPEEVVMLAALLASRLNMARYVPHEFMERCTYGTSLYGKPAEVRDENVRRLFEEKLKLNMAAGDSVIVVTVLQPTSALLRKEPESTDLLKYA
jgi:Acetyltransferase (GNAT) family